MNPAFWNGKRVLITGHTGFKGSWLSLWLQMLSSELSGYALAPPTSPSLFELARVGDGMFSAVGDVEDLDDLKRIIAERRPEIIFHLAAQSLVRASYENPISTYRTNVIGTANVLEASRHSNTVRVVVVVTSDKCYENIETGSAYSEDAAMGGFDPYSSSKGCAELVTASYRNAFLKDKGIAVATARAGNVIGGGDWAKDRLMTDIIEALLNKKTIRLRNPAAIRPWQHAQNPLEGYLMLAERLWTGGAAFSEGWNFGPPEEDERSVEWIVRFLTKTWGSESCFLRDDTVHPHEANVLRLDASKARARLSWRPKISLKSGLDSVADWHQAHQSGEDMQVFTLQQILQNQELVPA